MRTGFTVFFIFHILLELQTGVMLSVAVGKAIKTDLKVSFVLTHPRGELQVEEKFGTVFRSSSVALALDLAFYLLKLSGGSTWTISRWNKHRTTLKRR